MNDEGETTEQKAQADLERQTKIYRSMDQEVGGKGYTAEDSINVAIGQNVLREEIGYFGPWEGARYKFDDETRDRLLAHGRQDAASAFAMARSAFKEAHYARRVTTRAALFLLVLIALHVAILATLWLSR